MPRDVIITPASGLVDFKDDAGNIDAKVQIDTVGNLSITNSGGNLSIGDSSATVYIGDGVSGTDIVFEQSGAIRALSGKTLTLGASGSLVSIAAPTSLLSTVSLSGVLTTSAQLTSTVATGTAPLTVASTTRVANLNVATAGTADTLTTARTINGVSFNGSSNITITSAPANAATQLLSLGVGTAASATTGEIRATNQITAFYSDERLKENITTIKDAINKVVSLKGVTYNSNALAAKFGYNNQAEQVGVIAQDVKRVLPHAVKPAPFDIGVHEDGTEFSVSGENYMTVQYEKIVPLLIEAIKDQQKMIEEMQRKLNVDSKYTT